jgi:hypothetical protein
MLWVAMRLVKRLVASRAIARGRKARESSANPAHLFTYGVSKDRTPGDTRIFDEKHAILLIAEPRHDFGGQRGWHIRIAVAADEENGAGRRSLDGRVPREELF